MPLQDSSIKKEKQDHKQILLDLIANQYGTNNAVVMDKALKTQDKQIEEAMNQGMSAEDIGKSKGIDFNLLNSLIQNSGQVKSTGESTDVNNDTNQIVQSQKGLLGKLFGQSKIITNQQGQPIGIRQGGVFDLQRPSTENTISQLVDLAKMQQTKNTKGVYGFDPAKGTVTLQAEVPANADIRNLQPTNDLSSLPVEEQPVAQALARKLYGVRGAKDGLPAIIKARLSGISFDQIEDKIRYSSQSPEFSGSVRDAVQQMSIGKSDSVRNADFDALDDYIQKGDMGGAKDYLKEMARTTVPTDLQNQIRGKERSVEFLSEIQDDLNTLEKNGFDTNFFTGNWENLLARVGQVRNPEMRKIATKIAVAVMNYRRSMTGVQFSYPENKEYFRLFPNITKVSDFNTASINGLNEVFKGDLDKFYSMKMGKKNYQKVFGEETKQKTQQDNVNRPYNNLSDEELEKRINELRGKR